MPLVPPNLDQRTFEQLVTEVRRRVPTLTPEWTDLNESDPGITILQLFAFMSEQLLFQINQVPNKGLVTFLKMVGVDLHPATPAVADVTLTLASTSSDPTFDIDAGTRVETSGPPPGETTPVIFETTKTFTLINAELSDVVSQDCTLEFASHQVVNEQRTGSFKPFGDAHNTQDALFLVFDLLAPGTWPQARFRLRVNLKDSVDVGEPPSVTVDTGIPPRLRWSFASGKTGNLDGTESLVFTTFEPALDSTNEFTRSGYVELEFNATTALAFFRAPIAPSVPPFFPDFFQGKYVIKVEIARPEAFEDVGPPEVATIRLNTVPAHAVQTVSGEVVGASLGLPFQRFRLVNAPVVPKSVVLEITPAPADELVWTETPDLFSEGPDARKFQLLPATGEILFGNGVFGKIPPPDNGTQPGGNITAQQYQFGGGPQGNLGAGTLTNVTLTGSGLPAFASTNVLPAAGGADEEPVEDGVARAPAVVRSRFRAVTARDFEVLAMETPDVRVDRAFTLPNTRPDLLVGAFPGSVTVLLVPHALFEESIHSAIAVQPFVAAAVLRFLDERRLVTTEVFTDAATFRKITVDATLQVEPLASVAETRSAALTELNRFFHALEGGTDGAGWPFGGTVFFSLVFERLLSVPGVARVDTVLMNLDDGTFVECADLPLNPGELLFSGEHVVRARASA